METIVETQKLCKDFAGRLAVDHVDVSIRRGDIYGLIGKNGAGKTTFMRMVCGLAAPTGGSMTLFGSSELEAQRRKMGCTIENPALYPAMSAEENLEVYRRLMGIDNSGRIPALLDFVGLHHTGQKKARDFSLGMKQRLMIAIALLGDPELLVLDEPMNGLDPAGIKEVRDLLVKLNRERNLTIVISSHILEELSKIATRYGIIHNGKLVDEFSAKELDERCRKNLRITVSDPDAAAAVLRDRVTDNIELAPNGSILLYDHLWQAGEINRLLMNSDIEVTALVPGEEELEDYFMNLIGGKAA